MSEYLEQLKRRMAAERQRPLTLGRMHMEGALQQAVDAIEGYLRPSLIARIRAK